MVPVAAAEIAVQGSSTEETPSCGGQDDRATTAPLAQRAASYGLPPTGGFT